MGRGGFSRWARVGAPMAIGVAFVATGSCIAIIDKNADQCDTNADCDAKGAAFANRVCTAHVCVRATGGDSDVDSTRADAPDADVTTAEADVLDSTFETTPDTQSEVDSADAGDSEAGVFVVAGTTLSGGVLVALDPNTGEELRRETMNVSAIVYDPGLVTGGGDVWYIFEDTGGTTDAGVASSKLHARTFNPVTKSWTELAVLADVPKPKSSADLLVMNKRIVYMAPYNGSDPLGVGQLYLIDIGTPTAPKLVCDGCLPGPANVVTKGSASEIYLGRLVGGRADDTFTGGTLGIGFAQACTGAGSTCPAYFQRFRYTGNDGHDIPGAQTSFGAFTSDVTIGLGTSYRHKTALMVVPDSPTKGRLLQNSQTFFGAPDTVGSFDYSGRPTFSPVVVAGCDDVALFTTFANKLYAVPFTSTGLTFASIEGGSASQVAFDTRTKVVAYIANTLKAARVSTTPGLSLTALSWPTHDFVPTAIRGREPARACSK